MLGKMKKSIYNTFIEGKDCGYVYNSLSGALIRIEKEKYEAIQNNERISENISYELNRCGIFVPENLDELQKYNNLRQEYIRSDSTLRLVIAPTLDCNFRCPYCFEKHVNEYMSETIQDRIIQFVESRFKTGEYRRLLVSWYGGEPLLCVEIIERLSRKFISLCEKYNIIYWSYMVTNGYLLEKYVKNLVDCEVKEIQVTIDGPKEIHNSRRILHRNVRLGTYDDIISGVKKAAQNKIKMDIRVNLDLRNKDEVYKLFSEITSSITERGLIKVYPGKLFCMPSTQSSCDDVLLGEEEFVNIQILFDKLSKQYGFRRNKDSLMPKFRFWYCPAPYGNSIVIAPNGQLYACWNDIGQEEFAIGDLSLNPCIYETKLEKWKNIATELDDKCRKCSTLPICGGGCLRSRVHGIGTIQCDDCYSKLNRILIHKMELK